MSTTHHTEPSRVVIVGGGIAAVETVLALHDLAGDRVEMTLIAPEPDFTLRPLSVAMPFGRGHADALPLADVMAEHGGHFRRGAVLRIDGDGKTVSCADGPDEPYDSLVLATGATSIPAFRHALTFGADPLALNGILADLEQGWSHSVAFVVPRGSTWPLPIYELALMTAEQVWSMGMPHVTLHLVTPELSPLDVFGTEASAAVVEMLEAANVRLHRGVSARIERNGIIETGFGDDIVVDRIVSLPLLEGPRLDGVPCDAHGFIPVTDDGAVIGMRDVFAVGDATDRRVKQGGVACQQADVTAARVAANAGADVEVPELELVLRGRLLTGRRDRFLKRELPGRDSAEAEEPLWWPPTKVTGKYLSPYLEEKDLVHLPMRNRAGGPGVDVDVPLSWQDRRKPEVLGLNPLG